MQALKVHMDAATAGNAEAHLAVEAALHSLLTLKSAPAGVLAILEEPEALRKLCQVLLTPLMEAAKLVLDMLLHILIFNGLGYHHVVKVPLNDTCLPQGQDVPPVWLLLCNLSSPVSQAALSHAAQCVSLPKSCLLYIGSFYKYKVCHILAFAFPLPLKEQHHIGGKSLDALPCLTHKGVNRPALLK